jgi:hypothetical protein
MNLTIWSLKKWTNPWWATNHNPRSINMIDRMFNSIIKTKTLSIFTRSNNTQKGQIKITQMWTKWNYTASITLLNLIMNTTARRRNNNNRILSSLTTWSLKRWMHRWSVTNHNPLKTSKCSITSLKHHRAIWFKCMRIDNILRVLELKSVNYKFRRINIFKRYKNIINKQILTFKASV